MQKEKSGTGKQIKTYMNNWITDNEVAISGFIPNVSAWEVEMVRQANAAGGDVKAYLLQCLKIKRHLGNIV